ncbi:mobilization protein [Agrobacterium cavarae]|uniref:mobilization protein n=1 Tax=Agrobacterium cavarae TaxID=2528239 RepID=UPI0028B0BF79|nr:mobilization protein [Agrobacterium cavarae]
MRKPIEQRIRELEEQKKALQSRLEKQQRAETTRRRMLLGSFLLERLEQDGDGGHPQGEMDGKRLRQWLAREFPAYLSRDADRLLFVDLLWPQNKTKASTHDAQGIGSDGKDNGAAATLQDSAQHATGEDGGSVQP